MLTRSWKTTGAGLAGLVTLIATTVKQLLDGDPTTNPDWNVVIPLVFTSIIGLFARDKNVTSEQQGVK
jgi:hypothetical protein